MLVLAIDSSSKSVSVALLKGDELILELDSRKKISEIAPDSVRKAAGAGDHLPAGYVRKRSKGGSKTSRIFPPGASVLLAPMIDSLLKQVGISVGEIGLFSVAVGPGSFTGLRVGVVTAKSLAYSTGAAVLGVSTLETIAAKTAIEMNLDQTPIRPVLNAQRQQVFSGCYVPVAQWNVKEIQTNQLMDRMSLIKATDPGDVLTGSGLKPIVESMDFSEAGVTVAPENCWESSAADIGNLAWRQFEDGKRDSLWELQPFYFRPSTAEEVLDAKQNGENVR